MAVGLKAALLERLGGKITHEQHIVAFNRSRGKFGKFKQQAGLGLPIFFAGVPETVVAYLVKAFWQYMEKEATEELNSLYPFSLPLVRVMVLVFYRNVAFVHGNEPVIGDGDPKDVTGEVLQHSILTCAIGFAVRAPLSVPDVSRDLLEEVGMPLLQRLSEASGNHGRELSYRHEKFVRSIVPGGPVIDNAATGNHHMHMRMMM